MSLWTRLFGQKASAASKAGGAAAGPRTTRGAPTVAGSVPAAKTLQPGPPVEPAGTLRTSNETSPAATNRRIRVFISSTSAT